MTIPRTDPPRAARFGALALLLWASASAVPAGAASTDPLQSDDCRSAIASMQAEEAAEAHRHAGDAASRVALPTPSAPLQAARRDAATRCLASRADVEPPRGRFAQAPIVVEPVGTTSLSALRPLAPATARPTPLPLPPRRADAVVSCDRAGCWANDGSRLQRIGPVLWGPHGACTVQGASLQCP